MSALNNPTLNPGPVAPAHSWFQTFADVFYMPTKVSDSIFQVEDRLPGLLKPVWRGIMMLFWAEFSLRVAFGILYYGTPGGAKGMMIGMTILVGILETVIRVEDRLPRWLQWVWRGLSMLCSLCFAVQVPFWYTRLVIEIVLMVKSCGMESLE